MKFILKTGSFYLFGIIMISFISSCSNTKYLKEGQKLYTGAKIKIEGDSISKREKSELKVELEEDLTPKPNSTILGLRPKLFFYNITKEPEKQKGFRYWMKYKLGEEPVLLSQVDQEFNREILVNHSENKGYFNAKSKSETKEKDKKANVIYTVTPKERYYINQVTFPKDSTLINSEIQKTTDKSFLKKGDPFDLDVIIAERERINSRLKEKGFYYFHPDNIIVQADSTVTEKQDVELIVKLKDDVPKLATEQFTIDKIIIFPNFTLKGSSDRKELYEVPSRADSLPTYVYKDMYIIDPEKKFKPKIFDRVMYFQKGDLYNRSDHNLTLNRLINLGVFKFVKNEFVISDSLNNKFDVYYTLTPNELQSLRLEVLGRTNSANYGGGELNLNWSHRNFFKGAELFKVAAYGAFDVQLGGPKDANNIMRLGLNTQLTIPRIVAPFPFSSSSAFVPKTNIKLGYEFQNRTQLYTLHNFNTSFGYAWKENIRKEHELTIFDATLVYPQKITDKYREQMESVPSLQRVVEKQLIFGPTYSYTYSTTMTPRKNTVYFKGRADLSGNLTGLLTGANYKEDNQKEIFKIPFSQYAKVETDFRFYHNINKKTSIATRFIAGVAYPYGNSEYIPFSKQFFTGGSNSVRAFRARSLGPGSYNPDSQNSSFYFDQAGDIKLELNAEYRANIYKFLNAAVFVDAGNVWLMHANDDFPGGKFSKDFLDEIAVGAGFGLRMDFSILILRLDLAMPLRVPFNDSDKRWTFDQIDFGNKNWRKDNLILNIAIGYPF